MTTATLTAPPLAHGGRAVVVLARIEARRHLRGAALWLGLLGLVYFGLGARETDWQSGVYSVFPVIFVPLVAATFVAAVRSGGRDRHADLPPLAEEAPLDDNARAIARLFGLTPFVAACVLLVIGIETGIRIEGGLWVGIEPGRTDSAVHTIPELLQPIALVLLAAAAGVAAGRRFRRRGPITLMGLILVFITGFLGWWAFQVLPLAYVTLVQTQPVSESLELVADIRAVPDDWLLEYVAEERGWVRVYVDQPMIAGHVVYLLGWVAVCTAGIVGGALGRRWLWFGLAAVGVGLMVQVAATGFALSPNSFGS